MEQADQSLRTNLRHEIVYAALTYRGQRAKIQISSHAVCLASPVWKKALSFPRLPARDDDPSKASKSHEKSAENNWKAPETKPAQKPLILKNDGLDESELIGSSLGFPGRSDNSQNGGTQQPSTANKVLDLTASDGDSVLLLLRIAHLQFHKIPWKLRYDSLLKVAILCDYPTVLGLLNHGVYTGFPMSISNQARQYKKGG